MRFNHIIPSTFKDIVPTDALVRESIEIIKNGFIAKGISPQQVESEVCLAFSGGKDSIVASHIATKYFGIKRGICETSFCLPNHILDFKKAGQQFSNEIIYANSLSWKWLLQNKQYIFPEKSVRSRFYSLRQQRTIAHFCAGKKPYSKRYKACITGRRGQENTIKSVFYDKQGTMQIHPIAKWKTEHIWSYILENKLFYPQLYDSSFNIEGASSWIALFTENYVDGRSGCWRLIMQQDSAYFHNEIAKYIPEAAQWFALENKK